MGILATFRGWADRLSFAAKPDEALLTPQAVDSLLDLLWQVDDTDEILRKAQKTRRELMKVAADDEVAAAIDTRRDALESTPWRLEPATGPVSEFLYEQLQNWLRPVLVNAFEARLYGYSVTEVIYGETATARGVKRFAVTAVEKRPFWWFTPGRDGVLRMHIEGGLYDYDFTGVGQPVDTVDKYILTRVDPSWHNPRGEALLSRCYWPWFLRSAGWRQWARFLERTASPLLVGKSQNTVAMANALAAAVQSAVAAVGKDDDVFSVGSGQGYQAYKEYSEAVDRRIQKAILGTTLTTSAGGGGNRAQAETADNAALKPRKAADIKLVTPSVQQLLATLVKYNFPPGTEVPRFVMEDPKGISQDRADRDLKLSQTGQIEFTEAYWLNRYEFEPGEIRAVQRPAPAAGPPVQASAGLFARTMQSAKDFQGAIDALADKAIDDAGPPPIDPDLIFAAVRDAEDPDDLQRRLERIAGDLPRGEFAELVGRAMFAASVLGYVHDYEHGARKGGGE